MLMRNLTREEMQNLSITTYKINGVTHSAIVSNDEKLIKNIQEYINDGILVQEDNKHYLVLNNPSKYKTVYKENRGSRLAFYDSTDHVPRLILEAETA